LFLVSWHRLTNRDDAQDHITSRRNISELQTQQGVIASDEQWNKSEYVKKDIETLEDVLQRNGDSALLDEILKMAQNEETPPLIFGWVNIEPFVQQVTAAPPVSADGAAIPCPFVLPAPLTVDAFKRALLNHVRLPDTATIPRGTSVLPGNQRQYIAAISNASILNADPWFLAVAGSGVGIVPIADVFIVAGHKVESAIGHLTVATGARLWR